MPESSQNSHVVLFNAKQIQDRVNELAVRINTDYNGRTLDVICLINSASFFCADLIRQLVIPTRLHFMSFVSYPGENVTGEVRITLDFAENLTGRDVLVVEGIVVSGRTPRYLLDIISLREPASLTLCALAIKPKLLTADLPLNYVAFELGKEIAVGYGVGTDIVKTLNHIISFNQ
jgi:hypoxanthine phosphoribosyltransferase